jgi:hypothetical protein
MDWTRRSSIPEPSSSDEADQESRLDGIFKTLAGGHPRARVQFEAPPNQPRVKFDDLPKTAQPEEAIGGVQIQAQSREDGGADAHRAEVRCVHFCVAFAILMSFKIQNQC